ncbi:hypothetical protein LCGC14_0963430 [marine sediment metagenome]|uniref:Uncharacterized protein n=1 Tax=marine sediment metagenome TaxID=412755 RepID=A0A0F9NIB5_9ZZZZ
MLGRLLRKTMKYFPMGRIRWNRVIFLFQVHPYHMSFGWVDDSYGKGYLFGPIGLIVKRRDACVSGV